MTVAELVEALKAGREVRELDRALAPYLTRKEARQRLNDARDAFAMLQFAARLNGTSR